MKDLTKKTDNRSQNKTNTGLVRSMSRPDSEYEPNLAGVQRDRLISIVRDGGHPSSMYAGLRPQAVMSLQRTIGNQAVQRLIRSGALQAKLKVGRAVQQIQRQQKGVEEGTSQAQGEPGGAPTITPDIETQITAMRSGGGEPLAERTRTYFEPRFSRNFSQVRVHRDTRAANTARALNARAYTTGYNVVFGAGEYAPETSRGKWLLAHELTHVVQQKHTGPQIQRHGNHTTVTRAVDKYRHTLRHARTNQRAWERNLVNNATFLGMRIRRGAHRELVDRLTLATTFLRGRPGNSGLTDAQIASRIGLYSISGRRAPGIAVGGGRISYHAFGLAIDVNYRGNPFIGRSVVVARIIQRATNLILGRRINIRAAPGRLSLEQLRRRHQEASDALRTYFSFRTNRTSLIAHLNRRRLPAGRAVVNRWMRRIRADYRNRTLRREFVAGVRDPAHGFIDLTEDLVVALGSHAGLVWGGQYRGGKDLMHFDWRNGTVRNNHRI